MLVYMSTYNIPDKYGPRLIYAETSEHTYKQVSIIMRMKTISLEINVSWK